MNLDEAGLFVIGRGRSGPTRGSRLPTAESIHQDAGMNGCRNEVFDLERARKFHPFDPVQGAADGATALAAVGRTAEDARLDVSAKVCRIVHRHL